MFVEVEWKLPAEQRKRHDPRRDETRTALIEAAETMFAEAGVEGVSTRNIGAAIGSLNTNVVAYHFGSKEALVDAIFRHRLPAIDRRRAELLEDADRNGSARTILELMRVFALPLYEQVDARGEHSFARFSAGVERSGRIAARGKMIAEFPHSEIVISRIAALLPDGLSSSVNVRMRLAMSLITSALLIIDREIPQNAASHFFENTIAMAATAIATPASPGGNGP